MSKQARRTVRKRRPEERPQEILDAAIAVFLENGFRGTRLEDVAARAGVTRGAIYHYFERKPDLLVQAIRGRIRSSFRELEETAAREGGPAIMRLRLVLRRAWQAWCQPEWAPIVRLMLGELQTDFPALVDAWLDEGPRKGSSLVEQILEEGRKNEEFRRDLDTRVAARFLLSGLMFQLFMQVQFGSPEDVVDPERMFDSALDTLTRGIQPSAAMPPDDRS
ncbi:MAG: TetR/AcrR family transcriptional regulator [Gemmatimonadota bacterium]|jgi:AcrR family transcriptional regulator